MCEPKRGLVFCVSDHRWGCPQQEGPQWKAVWLPHISSWNLEHYMEMFPYVPSTQHCRLLSTLQLLCAFTARSLSLSQQLAGRDYWLHFIEKETDFVRESDLLKDTELIRGRNQGWKHLGSLHPHGVISSSSSKYFISKYANYIFLDYINDRLYK